MRTLQSAAPLSEGWIRTLEATRGGRGGRLVHVVTAIAEPGPEVPGVRVTLDKFLADRGLQSIDTVAETIFPSSLYDDPGFSWEPSLSTREEEVLDHAARDLYGRYTDILPLLRTVRANRSGTYFSRMITWPGREEGGTNQLDLRIKGLRSEARARRRTNNTLDIDLAADSLDVEPPLPGVQVYAAKDKRHRGFPCLTHIDLTLHHGLLHCTAVYRHQYLIQKAYGNLVGLAGLMTFLCQQGGCVPGELAVHATMADAEPSLKGIDQLIVDANDALVATVSGSS